MAAHTPLQGDRAAWCRERLEFFSAVINNLDRERLKAELENCETEEDAEGLMHSLLWLQDNMHTHFQGGATAIDPPEPHEPPEREFEHDIAEEHQPAQQPLMLDPWTLNIPMDAGEPHAILQDVVYLGNHEQQQRREEEEEQQEEHEHVDFEDYEAPPQAMCEPEVLDVARPESHIHQPLEMEEEEEEEEEQQHQEYQQEQQLQQEQQQNDQDLLLQHAPLRRTDCPQPGSVSDLVFADALDFPHPAHMHDFPAGRPADDASDAEDPEWVEVESRENTPVTARSDVDTDADTEPMEPISDPYFDVDEPSTEDFVDVEDVPLEEMVVMPSSQAEANIQPAADDLEVEGTTGGLENDPLADEELAKELSDAINEEERRRLESDEQMARALAEQMEMEERQREEEEKRREEEDEELARRLAEEIQNEEVEQLEQRRQRLEENMVPSDSEREEGPDGDEELAQQAHDEELARQMEAEVLEEMREEEDEKAGRVAALINMFPDADPTYLTERMEAVESEKAFRNAVEALLQCQKTEPRMSGHQKLVKQTHATRDHEEAPPESLGATAAPSLMVVPSSSHVFECTICFEEAVPIKDVATCDAFTNYHLFCIECIRKHVAALIGQGQSKFRCMNGYCEAEFSWRTLRRVMEPVVYRKVQEQRQQEEVMAAGVENLVSCPFCCFMIIMPDPENKVLECLNPECLKESCRMCKESSHIPLRCEEVERETQKDARTMLENRMAEAMIRQCPRCGKRFVTEGGCNKMTCSCGTVMCYVCKKVITDGYNHFEQRGGVVSNKCPLWTNATELHSGEVRQAAQQGRQEMDPGLRLVHDPTLNMD